MKAAIGDEIGLAVAHLAVDHASEINSRFANKMTPELNKKFSIRQSVRQCGKLRLERLPHSVDVERFVTWKIWNAETAAHVELGQWNVCFPRKAIRAIEDFGLHVYYRFGGKGLTSGEDMQSAKIAPRVHNLSDQGWNPLRIDAERFRPAPHLHPRTFKFEIGVHPNRQRWGQAQALGDGNCATGFRLAFQI